MIRKKDSASVATGIHAGAVSKIKAAKDLNNSISPNLEAFRTELSKVGFHNCYKPNILHCHRLLT